MRIGLVRHFKVKKGLPERTLISQIELIQWFEEYDVADLEDGEVYLGDNIWKKCFTSDLPRAIKTAEKIYNGNIVAMKELRELQPHIPSKRKIKLPFLLWAILIRCGFLTPRKYINDYERRVETVLDEILSQSDEDILIVSHGALMIYMRKELLKRGFKGPKFKIPDNGKLYVFEK